MVGIKTLLLSAVVVAVSGCSPYVYNQEITSFSNGVTAIVTSYQTGTQAIDASVVQQRLAADAAARTRLALLPGCTQMDPSGTPPALPDCALVPFGVTAAPPPTAVQQALAKAAPAFDALKTYAASLAAVTNAADDTTLKTASQSLTTAASGVSTAVAKLDPAAKTPGSLVAPIGGLLGQGITIYLDQRRYAVLKGTVPALDPAVQTLGATVNAALQDIRKQQLAQLEIGLLNASQPFEMTTVGTLGQSDYQTKLVDLDTKIAAFNLARSANPTTTVTAMVESHHQLSQALQTDAGQTTAVLTSAQTFAAAAQQLQTAITAAAAATTKAAPVTAKK
jgi:hypothetical protein